MTGYYDRAQALYNALFNGGGFGNPNEGQVASMPNSVESGVLSESTAKGFEAALAKGLNFAQDENGGWVPTIQTIFPMIDPTSIPMNIAKGYAQNKGKSMIQGLLAALGFGQSPNLSVEDALGMLGFSTQGSMGNGGNAAADAAGLAAALGASQGTGIL